MNIHVVYLHTWPNGECYVGQGIEKRASHFTGWRSKDWIKRFESMGPPEVSILHKNLTLEESHLKEIEEFEILRIKGVTFQRRPRPYVKRIMPYNEKRAEGISKALKGRKLSDERIEKIRIASRKQKGKKRKPLSEEHKEKISRGGKGKKRSDETRLKIAEANRMRKGEKRKPRRPEHSAAIKAAHARRRERLGKQ